MVTKNEVELAKIKADSQKAQWEYRRTMFVSGAAAIIVAALSVWGSIYVAYVQRESSREIELIKIDADLVKSFSDQFLAEDLGTRIRAAHLFTSIAPSADIRSRWEGYHVELTRLFNAIMEKGGNPGEDIIELMKDSEFRENFGKLGCRMNNSKGCVANRDPAFDTRPLIDRMIEDAQRGVKG